MATVENHPALPEQVLLYHNSIPVAICSTKLFTHDSLELYCGPLRYERNTDLEVEVQFDPGQPESRFRLPMRVVRCNKNHLVLCYESIPEEAEAYLQDREDMAVTAYADPAPSHYAH
ncbi:hypothetical protein [Thiohalorhabdus methylotrophus]|uniref:PilZ domain-containing protein n=1 Tax=Thiohalorhabdus methylotrophus TaxID=3242694 RepID=A0ABV4TYV0_9GAMM